MGANFVASLLPLFVIVVGAVTFALYVLLAPIAAVVFALLVPFFPSLLFGAPLVSALPLLLYEVVILGLIYFLKKRKSSEISKW